MEPVTVFIIRGTTTFPVLTDRFVIESSVVQGVPNVYDALSESFQIFMTTEASHWYIRVKQNVEKMNEISDSKALERSV